MPKAAPQYATAPIVGFRSRKAAQLCAYFAVLAGGTIEKLKLIKLVYLTERAFLGEHHHTILFDEFYSLPSGPICSATLNGIDGIIHTEIWDEYLHKSGNIRVANKKYTRAQLDELSNAEVAAAGAAWEKFGGKTSNQLVTLTHAECREWTEVAKGKRLPISYGDVLRALGDEDAESVEQEISALRRAESALAG